MSTPPGRYEANTPIHQLKGSPTVAPSNADRRSALVRNLMFVVVGLVAIGIVAVAVLARVSKDDSPAETPGVDSTATLPTGVYPADHPQAFGVAYGSNPKAPVLEVWEDFQCPGCGLLERTRGKNLQAMADNGDVLLVWRPTTFLDAKLGNDSSSRALAAWGCAIDEGKTKEFHDIVYANQPQTEGDGWTDEQLISFGEQAGAGATFKSCVTAKKYSGWAANALATFQAAGLQGTPTLRAGGVDIPRQSYGNDEAILNFVKNLQVLSDPSASAAPAPSGSTPSGSTAP